MSEKHLQVSRSYPQCSRYSLPERQIGRDSQKKSRPRPHHSTDSTGRYAGRHRLLLGKVSSIPKVLITISTSRHLARDFGGSRTNEA
eukprot:6213745-Pleurochrysis_carterae.AAC.2